MSLPLRAPEAVEWRRLSRVFTAVMAGTRCCGRCPPGWREWQPGTAGDRLRRAPFVAGRRRVRRRGGGAPDAAAASGLTAESERRRSTWGAARCCGPGVARLACDDHRWCCRPCTTSAVDEWSMGDLMREVAALYQRVPVRRGRSRCRRWAVQYADFAVWQRAGSPARCWTGSWRTGASIWPVSRRCSTCPSTGPARWCTLRGRGCGPVRCPGGGGRGLAGGRAAGTGRACS